MIVRPFSTCGTRAAVYLLATVFPIAASPTHAAMSLGVSTHFDQGWQTALLGKVADAHAPSIRDSISWSKGEPVAGHYDLTDSRINFAKQACADGRTVMLVIDPRNPVYDGGDTAYTPASQAAFGQYLRAIVDKLGSRCVIGFEIGNEINADAGMKLPSGMNRVKTYVSLLRAVYAAVKPQYPTVAIVGGSTNVIGTGFIEQLAAAGALSVMDAVAIHPYRDYPETVDVELERLRAAMARHGSAKPIWATEIGNYFKEPELAPAVLIKMTMLLAAGGIQKSYWYDLVDEPAFANMGLYELKGAAKPALDAFRLAQDALLKGGDPVRVDPGDRRTFIFKLASGGFVMWGDPRPVTITGVKAAYDSRGHVIALPTMLSAEPVVLPAGAHYALGESDILADSLFEFGRRPWSYLAQSGAAAPSPLSMKDWQWTSFYGADGLNPLQVNDSWLSAAGSAQNPVEAIVRYTAETSQPVVLSACFTRKKADGGVALKIRQDQKIIYQGTLVDELQVDRLRLNLHKGDVLDFEIAPAGGNSSIAKYRIQFHKAGASQPPICLQA